MLTERFFDISCSPTHPCLIAWGSRGPDWYGKIIHAYDVQRNTGMIQALLYALEISTPLEKCIWYPIYQALARGSLCEVGMRGPINLKHIHIQHIHMTIDLLGCSAEAQLKQVVTLPKKSACRVQMTNVGLAARRMTALAISWREVL